MFTHHLLQKEDQWFSLSAALLTIFYEFLKINRSPQLG